MQDDLAAAISVESDVNPLDYIAETLRAILDGHLQSRIEDLMPWRFDQTSTHAA